MNRLSDDIPVETPTPRRGPVALYLRLFSSIWLGVTLLTLLFVYGSIGSAGWWWPTAWCSDVERPWVLAHGALTQFHVRQAPALELSEFEWFHWWPFDVLITLICVNLVTATLRRIPFKPVNYGVWMIHTGIIVLALGSVYYFGTKKEGDTPVVRRTLVANLPGYDPVSVIALPGNTLTIGDGADRYEMSIAMVDPSWELLSGDDRGERAYKITVSVSHGGQRFLRELLANYPQYTEDLVRSGNPEQPIARAKKELGTPLVDENLQLTLAPATQDTFYLVDTAALYLRPAGGGAWTERPIKRLPRYNDRVVSLDDVWPAPYDPVLTPDPLSIEVAAREADDPLAGHDLRVTGYLRYAVPQSRREAGGDRLDPTAWLTISSPQFGAREEQLVAFDRSRHMVAGGRVRLIWVDSEAALAAIEQRVEPQLEVTVPGAEPRLVTITDTWRGNAEAPYIAIPGTDYEYRVLQYEDGLNITGDTLDSVALVEVKSPERSFTRAVYESAARAKDFAPGADGAMGQEVPLEDAFTMAYRPGLGEANLVAGAAGEDDLVLLAPRGDGTVERRSLDAPATIDLDDGTTVSVDRYAARTFVETRPAIVPIAQRNRDAGVFYSRIRVDLPPGLAGAGQPSSVWLPFHHYVFKDSDEVVMRHRFEPTTIVAADGRPIEIMFARQRRPLPAPVALRDFRLVEHIGGYTGSTLSIRDWISEISFDTPDGWTDVQEVRVNAPSEHEGWWFFQAMWDPPIADRNYRGLNYTGLGGGNRNGVNIMLVGCCISVVGMIYAFYVKPFIKRRRQQAVYAAAGAAKAAAPTKPERRAEAVAAGEKPS